MLSKVLEDLHLFLEVSLLVLEMVKVQLERIGFKIKQEVVLLEKLLKKD